MNPEIDAELRDLRSTLQKIDDGLATMLQNPVLKAWNNINVDEAAEHIFYFGVRITPAIHRQAGGKNLQGLAEAQTYFRLHPTRKAKDDIYLAITDVRREINTVADALAMGGNLEAVVPAVRQATAGLQARHDHLSQAAKLLQLVYLNLKRFSLLDMVGFIRLQNKSTNPLEQRFLDNGSRLFALLEDKNNDSGAAGGKQLLPIGPCRTKSEDLQNHLHHYPTTLAELADHTSGLVPAVVADRFIAPVIKALRKVNGLLDTREGALEKLVTPVKEEFDKLPRAGSPADFADYIKEIDKTKKRVAIALSDLGRHEDFIDVLEAGNTIITKATAFSAWLRNLPDEIETEFRRSGSPLNLQAFAEDARRKYYSVGLFTLLKRFFSKRLNANLVFTILKTCPVLTVDVQRGNVKELKDTTTLNNFLHNALAEYADTMVYKDVTDAMRQAVRDYATALTIFMDNIPLNSPSLPAFYDCGSLLRNLDEELVTNKKGHRGKR